MSARAMAIEPAMATPMSAACKPREVRDVFISDSSIVFGLPQRAACVYPRGPDDHAAAPAQQAPIRPEFEEDAREVDGRRRPARQHFAGAQSSRTLPIAA